jgi:hypothetical protein
MTASPPQRTHLPEEPEKSPFRPPVGPFAVKKMSMGQALAMPAGEKNRDGIRHFGKTSARK